MRRWIVYAQKVGVFEYELSRHLTYRGAVGRQLHAALFFPEYRGYRVVVRKRPRRG